MTRLDPNPDAPRVLGYAAMREALHHADLTHGAKEFAPGNLTENVVAMLDGEDHKQRRRRENPLFRAVSLAGYEADVLPGVIAEVLGPMIARGAGDLLDFGYQASLVISAQIAGIDFDWRDSAQRLMLMELDSKFRQAASLYEIREEHIDQVRSQAMAALEIFEAEFFRASRARRATIAAEGDPSGQEPPADLLSALLLHQDELGLDDGSILREVAFFMESGGNSSVQLLAHTMNILLGEAEAMHDYRRGAKDDILMAQRCVLEASRLHPPRRSIRRRAAKGTVAGGCPVGKDQVLLLDIPAANTDETFWGEDAQLFNPWRTLPTGAVPAGLSFSSGPHSCIGRTLAVGASGNLRYDSAADLEGKAVYGLVPWMVHALLQADVRQDADLAPTFETTTYRTRWGTFPIRFGGGGTA